LVLKTRWPTIWSKLRSKGSEQRGASLGSGFELTVPGAVLSTNSDETTFKVVGGANNEACPELTLTTTEALEANEDSCPVCLGVKLGRWDAASDATAIQVYCRDHTASVC